MRDNIYIYIYIKYIYIRIYQWLILLSNILLCMYACKYAYDT